MATKLTKTARPEKTAANKVTRKRKTAATPSEVGVPTHEQIAQRAFSLFAARGFQHGADVEDWLAAERELTR